MFSTPILQAATLLATLSGVTLAAVHEKIATLPEGWQEAGQPADGQMVAFELALNQQNSDDMISRLYQVSDPAHADYGKHMDRDELQSMLAPTSDAHDAVMKWLQDAQVENVKSDGSYIDFATTVGKANSMFSTMFSYYQKDGVKKLRTMQYSVPDQVAPFVDLVAPTVFFGGPGGINSPAPKTVPLAGSLDSLHDLVATACATFISPACVRELYNIGDYTPDPKSGSNIAFGSFLNQSAQYNDLSQYERFFGLPQQSFAVELINGGVNNQSASAANVGEADLDVQNIVGASHPLPIREYITGGSPPFVPDLNEPTSADNQNEPYLQYYRYLLSKDNKDLPQVITNSYGDVEETVPEKYAKKVCSLIAQLGMRGISVLESSGDTGVGAACRNPANNKPRFEPTFPASCPFITAVGGTQSVNPEIAWTGSSGGFSNYFTRPSYQDKAVTTYFKDHISPATLQYYQPYFNQIGRGFPDISAHSLTPNYLVVTNGRLSTSGGTSAAAPVVAAIIGLLNDARFKAGKPALGFLNPWLYSEGYKGLEDIVNGTAIGCNGVNGQTGAKIPGGGIIPYASWNGTVGWDPATGLGVPLFDKLMKLVLA